jgi:hypothetical protein
MTAMVDNGVAELRRTIAELQQRLDEALAREAATAEVLQVINSSPGDLAPVFDAMLEKATRLCDAAFGLMSTYDGMQYHTVATRGVGPELAEFMRAPPRPAPESGLGRIERGEDLVLFDDIADTELYRKGDPRLRAMIDLGGARSYVVAALRRESKLLGIIAVYRKEIRPFSDKQIGLLQNFAAQAVIAMQNARLINETREALEQQTATAEVLGVINSSPGDHTPVFDAILEKAHTLCGATHGALGTYDNDYYFRSVVARGYPQLLAERLQQGFDGLTNPVTRPLIDGAHFVHIPDLAEIDHPIPQAVASLGYRRGPKLARQNFRRSIERVRFARTLRWREMDSNLQFRDASPPPMRRFYSAVSGGAASRRKSPIGLPRPDDRSDHIAAPRMARPQLRRSLDTTVYLARN